ncbi:MAG: hypothetical protein GYB68_03875, partial [Chloroflexi bacterium]|nr:hypothetical protein [Chloroflexota bacterium]
MSSRDHILSSLREAAKPFADIEAPSAKRLPMTPLTEQDPKALLDRFVKEAEALSAVVYQPEGDEAATQMVLDLLAGQACALVWEADWLPLSGLQDTIQGAGIEVVMAPDPTVYVGITGATAALASTGTVRLQSGPGQLRSASLLPSKHIAIIREEQ